MGALAHYLEAQGIPTTQISLIREHTETIRPPRAMWVPFELGRPLGAPEDSGFQRRVLLATLELLDAPNGPLLVDFPEEAPEGEAVSDAGMEGWSCPVSFVSDLRDGTDRERLRSAFKREVAEFRPWYDLSLERRKRTAVVDFGPDLASALLDGFAAGETPGERALKHGRLQVSEGMDSPGEMVRYLASYVEKAGPLRLAGDGVWAIRKGWDSAAIRTLEEAGNALRSKEGTLFLCQYSLEDFSGLDVMMAAELHEQTIYKGRLERSPYFGVHQNKK